MTRHLAELTGPQTREVLTPDSMLLVPIGAIEHHGPHLPLVTDALMAEAAVHTLVPQAVDAGLDAWIMPTLSLGKSDEHHWASGTLWLTATTLLETLVDLGRSVATTPARRLVFVNGHGGNAALLQVANRELRRRFGLQVFTMGALPVPAGAGTGTSMGATAPDELGLGIHGGWAETSIVMHLRPDLVRPEHLARSVPEEIAGYRHLGFNGRPVTFGWLSDDFGPSGVIGDPTGATAEAGRELFEAGIATGLEALDEIARFRQPARAPEPGA